MPVVDVQCDEIWGFVGMKEKTRQRIVKGDGDPTAERAAFAGSRFTPAYDEAHAEPLWVELTCAVGER